MVVTRSLGQVLPSMTSRGRLWRPCKLSSLNS